MSGRTLARRVARAGASAVPAGIRGAAFRALAPRLRIGGSEHGLLTLVVVVEEVDWPRLPDTLASISEQTHGYREVLIAPVGVAAVATARATLRTRRDPRIRMLPHRPTWQEAANLGGARARGRFLFFLRACDPVPPWALPELVGSLGESGSALATGVVAQRGQPEEWLRRAQERAHARPGRGLPPAERPEVAGDLVVGNRVLRTEAWRSSGLTFGPLDDWLLSPTTAHLLRDVPTVDVLDVTATEYLHEHGNRAFGSMPSSLPEIPAWRDRAAEIERVLTGSPLLEGWHAHVLDVAVPRFLKDAERATDAEWETLRELAAQAVAVGGDPLPEQARAEARTLLWLAAHDQRAQVAALAAEAFDLGADLRTRLDGDRVVAHWQAVSDDVPVAARALTPAETPLVAEVRRRRARPDAVEVDLAVRVQHLDLATTPHAVAVLLPDGTPVEARSQVDAAATRWAQARFQAAASVEVHVPVGTPSLRVVVTAGDLVREADVPLDGVVARDPDADSSVTVTGLRLDGTDLVLETEGAGSALTLVDDHDRVVARAADLGNGAVRFDLRHEAFGRAGWLPSARYRVLTTRGNPTLADALTGTLPVEEVGTRHRLRAFVGPFGGLVVPLAAPLADDEQGPYAQERLVEEYAGSDAPVDRGIAYFESYAGRSATDSPLAIFREVRARRPDLTAYWGVLDHAQWVPEGATPVLVRSRAWYDLLARAGCLLLNTDVEAWFRRRPGQVLLQTFHGYPSKGMGEGQWLAKHFPPSRVAVMRARGVDTWSAIVTPTPAMTEHYREQYGYDGPAFERGYPRDDDLTAPDAPERRARTRALLGLRDDQTAVLYAPTWRDHLATRPRGADMADLLDVEAATRALGDSHVLLLRGHRFHAPPPVGSRVIDVTGYPEINDLLLAADVAVLDYSSLRFDLALTGTPMVFLVPDLADYTGGTRAFLFPFEDSAPGPFVDDTAGVVEQVRDVDALRAAWADRIAAFNTTYHPYQDGHASARVAEGLLGLLGDPSESPADR